MLAISAFADDIRDIKPPVYFQAERLFLTILIAAALLAGIIVLAVFIWKRMKRKPLAPPPPRTPHEVAYEALERLRRRNLVGQARAKEYYFELSDIARRYVESRFSVRAPEMTTEEFLFSLKHSEILSGVHKNLLKEFLTLCDIVKFARYGPSEKEVSTSFEAAKRFVDETKKVEESPEGAAVK